MKKNCHFSFRIEFQALLFVALLFFFSSCCSVFVKEINTYSNRQPASEETFTCSGKITTRTIFKDGKITVQSLFLYSNGHLTGATFTDENNANTAIEYNYAGGRLMREDIYYNDSIIQIKQYVYASSGKVKKETIEDKLTGVMTEVVYEYDDLQQMTGRITMTGKIITETRVFIYDEKGNNIEEIINSGESNSRRILKSHDSDNRMTEFSEFFGEEFVQKMQYLYNRKNRLLTVIHLDEEGFIVRKEKYAYNYRELKKSVKIIDYRNYDGKMKPQTETIQFRYVYH